MYEVFEKLLALNNTTASKVAKATGIAPSTFSDWKNGRYSPKTDKLQTIADYFGVSVKYLMTGEDEPQYYIDPEAAEIAQEMYDRPELKVLMDASRKLSADDIKAVQAMVEHLWKVQHPED